MGWELIDNAIPGHDIYSTKKHRDPNAPVGSEPDQTYDKFGNAYILSTWAELEPQPGVYDWSLVDRAIDHWSALGKRIQFRIATDPHVIIGYKHPDADRHEVYNRGAPDWLTDPEGEYAVPTTPKCHDAASVLPDCAPPRPWTPDQGGLDPSQYKRIYYVPDYENATYQSRLRSFLEAFGAHYDSDRRLETVDLMGYGEWGEWHSGHDFSSIEARQQFLRNVVRWWSLAFPHKVLGLSASPEYRSDVLPDVRNPATYEEFKAWSAFDFALLNTKNVGFRRDGFTGCVAQNDSELMREAWSDPRRLPISAEFCGGYPEVDEPSRPHDWKPEGIYRRRLEESLTYHPNYMTVMGWSGDEGAHTFYQQRSGRGDLIDQVNRRIGYHLVITQASFPSSAEPGGVLSLRQQWANRGVGRLWQGQRLRAYLVNAAGETVWSGLDKRWNGSDIIEERTSAKNSMWTLPRRLPQGNYSLRVALVDRTGRPAVKLNIAGSDSNGGFGRYELGTIRVGRGGAAPAIEDFEGVGWEQSAFTGGTNGTGGVLTQDVGKVISGSQSVLGEADPSIDWIDIAYSDSTKLRLEPMTSYSVTFKYRTNAAPEVGGSHYFLVRTPTGGYAKDLAFTQWTEEASANTSTRTVRFVTGNYSDYYLMWGLHKGGSLSLDDVSVIRQGEESFEGGSFSDSDYSGGTAGNTGMITSDAQKRISGGWSVIGSAPQATPWIDVLTSDRNKLKLRPRTTYTVRFLYRTLAAAGEGGGHYFLARTDSGGFAHDVGFTKWLEPSTDRVASRQITFTTDDFEDYYLVWGLNKGGEIVLDDISVMATNDMGAAEQVDLTFEEGSGAAVNAAGPEDAALIGASREGGARGQGLAVTGGGYAELASSGRLDQLQEGSYTISAKFKANQLPPSNGSPYSKSYGIVIKPGWHTGLYYDQDGHFRMSQCFSGPRCEAAISLNKYDPQTWHTITGVVNRTRSDVAGFEGTVTLYVDGHWQATTVVSQDWGPYYYASAPWRLGVAIPGLEEWGWSANGAIDDVRMWSRALGDKELQALDSPAWLAHPQWVPGRRL